MAELLPLVQKDMGVVLPTAGPEVTGLFPLDQGNWDVGDLMFFTPDGAGIKHGDGLLWLLMKGLEVITGDLVVDADTGVLLEVITEILVFDLELQDSELSKLIVLLKEELRTELDFSPLRLLPGLPFLSPA